MAQVDDLGEAWRSAILKGVTRIPATGMVPGTILVWGHSARPILNSGSPSKPVLVAAAELGNGRVVAVAHKGVLDSTPELLANIEAWLMNGGEGDKHVLNKDSKYSDIKNGDLIIWNGAKTTGDITNEDVIHHILGGSGLLHTSCPWGWLQLNKGKSLMDMPLFGVLKLTGMCYTGQYGSIPSGGLDIEKHRATEASHIGLALQKMYNDLEHMYDDESCDLPILDLASVPDDVCTSLLCPELRKLAEALGCQQSDNQTTNRTESVLKNLCPKPDSPVKGNRRVLIDILDRMAHLELASLPAVDSFLGSVPPETERTCTQMKITSNLEDVHPTGYYLAKDDTLVLQVQGDLPAGWRVQIGAHSDNLTKLQAPLRRWPQLVTRKPINSNEVKIHSPYGGLVYLMSPKDPSEIVICLENVIEAPLFNACDPEAVQSWKKRRQAAGPWSDIIGKTLIITLPSSSVRHIDDPSDVMSTWDSVISGYHELRGTDPEKHRRQWVVTDEQPVVGYMHAGYPIVTHLDVARPDNKHFLLSKEVLLDEGHWGLYHEIGHNMQRQAWTFQGTSEVTCNIFTLYAMDTVSGQAVWIHKWLRNNMAKVKNFLTLASGSFAAWKSDPGLALFVYAQIIHHFGWEVYKQVFREYEQTHDLDKVPDQKKIDSWIKKISEACKHNLVPLFDFWKIPVSQEVVDSLQHLPACLPHDEVTDINPEYAGSIRAKYNISCD